MTVDELIQNESIKARIQSAKSLDEVAEILNENGIDVSVSDIEAAAAAETEDELNEEALENVAGGVSIKAGLKIIWQIIKHLPRPMPMPMPIIPKRRK